MVKSLALLLLTGTLAACGSNPKAEPTPAPGEAQKGCYQADWQAETNPVLNSARARTVWTNTRRKPRPRNMVVLDRSDSLTQGRRRALPVEEHG